MYESEKLNLIMQQYKLYAEQKDNFISRSFSVNRFYMCLVIILLLLTNITKNVIFVYAVSLPFIFSIVGLGICVLWWMNMDSYNLLIKIKFSKVLEELEKQLPVKPYTMEHDGIVEYRENKKEFLFSDMQKLFAIVMFISFFVSLIDELIHMILQQIIL